MASTVRAGELRKRVEIQQPVDVDDGQGGTESRVWTHFANAWARIRGITVAERLSLADGEQSGATTRIVMRYRSGIKSTFRILYRDRVINLVGPPIGLDAEAGVFIMLTGKEVS